MRILLIDDDKDDQTLFRDALNYISSSFECRVADNGFEGLQHLKSTEVLPDLIFLDVNMPLMDGRETLEAMRNDPMLTGLPVVIYSTSNSERDISWFVERDARYVVKPNNFEQLVATLVDLLVGADEVKYKKLLDLKFI